MEHVVFLFAIPVCVKDSALLPRLLRLLSCSVMWRTARARNLRKTSQSASLHADCHDRLRLLITLV